MLIDLLELASNKTLQHDPQALERLAGLRGKTMVLRMMPIDQSLAVTPQQEGLEFSPSIPPAADVTLTATIGAMLKITRHGMQNATLEPGELEISGDPIIGQRFAQALSELDIDWETLLAEQLGESPAKMVTFAAGQAKVFAQQSRDRVTSFVNQLITEDAGLVADKKSVDQFLDDVDELRADTDRLWARLQRLQTRR